ncbi:MAG: hypothetical protein H8E55_41135 [Pelagibacterales bacterium]|nr:hypothetical protein [Pelagibacterales bacterium]
MNNLLEQIIQERKGHYCHALEVNDVYHLESVVESVIESFPEFDEYTYIDFFETLELYCLGEDEKQVYDFSFENYIRGTI